MIQLANDLHEIQKKSLWIAKLDKFLQAQNAFQIIKLQGFLTAINSGPQILLPSQRLPLTNIQEIDFESPKQATDIMGQIMSLDNNINSNLRDGTYKPLLYIFTDYSDDVEKIWQQIIDNSKLWAEGYLVGVEATWPCNDNMQLNHDFTSTLGMIYYLTLSKQDFIEECKYFSKAHKKLNLPISSQFNANDYYQMFIDCLPIGALQLYDFWLNKKNSTNNSQQIISNFKIWRNDPCHCGSGKKYKKCCLH